MDIAVTHYDELESILDKFDAPQEPEYEFQVEEKSFSSNFSSRLNFQIKKNEAGTKKEFLLEIDHNQGKGSFNFYEKICMKDQKLQLQVEKLNDLIKKSVSPGEIESVAYKNLIETAIIACIEKENDLSGLENEDFAPISNALDAPGISDHLEKTVADFASKNDKSNMDYSQIYNKYYEKSNIEDSSLMERKQSQKENDTIQKLMVEKDALFQENQKLKHQIHGLISAVKTDQLQKMYEKEISKLKGIIEELKFNKLNKEERNKFENHDQQVITNVKQSIGRVIDLKWHDCRVTSISYCKQDPQSSKGSHYQFNLLMGAVRGREYELVLLDKKEFTSPDASPASCVLKTKVGGPPMDVFLGSKYHIAALGAIGEKCWIEVRFGDKKTIIVEEAFKTWLSSGQKKGARIPKWGNVLQVDNDWLYFVNQGEEVCSIDLHDPKLRVNRIAKAKKKSEKIQAIAVLKDQLYYGTEDGAIYKHDFREGKEEETCYHDNSEVITAITATETHVIFATFGDDFREGNEVNLRVLTSDLQPIGNKLELDGLGHCVLKILNIAVPRTLRKCHLLVLQTAAPSEQLALVYFGGDKLVKVKEVLKWWPGRAVRGLVEVESRVLLCGERLDFSGGFVSPCELAVLRMFGTKF